MNINSFSELLSQGQIAEAILLRLEAIETKSRYYRQDLEAAKVSSAALGIVGLLLSANPLVAVIAGCGLASYGYTILKDYQNTKRLCLLPLVRKSAGDLLTGIGLAATDEQAEADDPLLGVIGYVEPELAHEYELVMVAESQLISYLAQLPGDSRLNAYRHILRHTRLRNSLKLPSLQDVALAISSPVQSQPLTIESAPAIEVEAEVIEDAVPVPVPPSSNCAESAVKAQPVSSATVPDTVGLGILDSLVNTRRSTLLIGDTGAGKSVAQAYILSKLFQFQPKTEAFVLTQKLDSFCGLAELGRVSLFDPTDPEPALKLIGDIWKVYNERRRLPESERPKLPPVRLILADWLSVNQALDDSKNEEPIKSSKYLTKLADIIYNGRELNVCLIIDLQSYNLAALGLKADRNSRKNFNLIGLGNYSIDELGMVNQSYGVLSNLINDRYIVASESERLALISKFQELQPISQETYRPIIFSGLSPAQLALLPDLRSYRSSSVSSCQQLAPTIIESAPEESAVVVADSSTELKVSDSLGEPLRTIWLFAKEQDDWVTARDVQRKDFAKLKEKNIEQIHQLLGLLADTGFGIIDEEGKSHSSVRFLAN